MLGNGIIKMEDKLLNIINTVLENSDLETKDALSMSMSLRDDLGLDSLALAELTVRIEESYGVDIFKDGNISSIQELVNKLS